MAWSELKSSGGMADVAPSPRSAHVAAAYQDRFLLVFGGGSVAHCYNDLHIFDTDSGTWEAVATEGKPPSPRAGAAPRHLLLRSHACVPSQQRGCVLASNDPCFFAGGCGQRTTVACHGSSRSSGSKAARALHRVLKVASCDSVMQRHTGVCPPSSPIRREPETPTLKPESSSSPELDPRRAGHAGAVLSSRWYITGGGNNRAGCSDLVALDLSGLGRGGTMRWTWIVDVEPRSALASEGLTLLAVPEVRPRRVVITRRAAAALNDHVSPPCCVVASPI